jgi:hypothetical protein
MPIDRIVFKRNYVVNFITHEHVHLGGEGFIGEGETREQLWEEMRLGAENYFKEKYPQYPQPPTYSGDEGLPVIQQSKPKPKMDIVMLKKYEQAILNKDVETIKNLEAQYNVESKQD